MTQLAQFSDAEIVRILHGYAAAYDLAFVAYYDDSEWHAQMIAGSDLVATAYGASPRESHEALLRNLGLA